MEFVYVVKEADLEKIREWTWWDYFEPGFSFHKYASSKKDYAFVWRILDKGFFMERSKAETDSSFKQIIPYCVLMKDDKVFLSRRRAGGGEKRLYGKSSIGLGGHINPVDAKWSKYSLFISGLAREIREETNLGNNFTHKLVGFLYNDIDKVSSVHLGFVYLITPTLDMEVRIKETDMLEGGFVSKEEAKKEMIEGNMEAWSKVVVKESGLF